MKAAVKEDLTQYNEDELSLIVFNNEYYYKLRRQKVLFEELELNYKYTSEQLSVLKQDLKEDLQEV